MKWQIKFLRNAVLDYLPLIASARRMKRCFFPYTGNQDVDSYTIEQGLLQVEGILKSGRGLKGKSVLELGTGWHPFIPILYSLAGCAKIRMVDEQRLMDANTFRNSLRNLARFRDAIIERLGIGPAELDRALDPPAALDLPGLLERFRMEYLAPADARALDVNAGSIDIVSSRAVLEHIPPAILKPILAEFRRIISPDGLMSHIIDNSDHWEHGDKSISRLNFLKFGAQAWRLISLNRLDYQNRLRHSDYLNLMVAAGFRINADHSQPDARALSDLRGLRLAGEFRGRDPGDLAILTSFVTAEPAPMAEHAELSLAGQGA